MNIQTLLLFIVEDLYIFSRQTVMGFAEVTFKQLFEQPKVWFGTEKSAFGADIYHIFQCMFHVFLLDFALVRLIYVEK